MFPEIMKYEIFWAIAAIPIVGSIILAMIAIDRYRNRDIYANKKRDPEE